MKVTIRMKLLGSALILLAFMGALGVLSIVSLGSVNTQAQDLYANNAVPLGQLGSVTAAVADERRLLERGIVHMGDAATQASIDQEMAADDASIRQNMDAYKATGLSADEQTQVATWDQAYPAYQQARDTVRTLTKANQQAQAVSAIDAASTPATQANDAATRLLDLQITQARVDVNAIRGAYDSALLLTIVFLVVATVLGFAISF